MNWFLLGGFLLVLGFFLTPFLIGIPIMLVGWLMAVFGFYYRYYRLLPQSWRDTIKKKAQVATEPNQQAIKRTWPILREMLMVSLKVFLSLCLVLLIVVVVKLVDEYSKFKDLQEQPALWYKEIELPLVPDNQTECEAQGGKWGKVGVGVREECNLKTTDAGSSCKHSKTCQGLCLADLSAKQTEKLRTANKKPIKAEGKCSEWRVVVGCRPVVTGGKVYGLTCID